MNISIYLLGENKRKKKHRNSNKYFVWKGIGGLL